MSRSTKHSSEAMAESATTEGMFLSREDLVELTDRQTARAQIAWLAEHGYRFEVSAAGRPKVLRSAVEARLGGAAEPAKRLARPRLDLVKG